MLQSSLLAAGTVCSIPTLGAGWERGKGSLSVYSRCLQRRVMARESRAPRPAVPPPGPFPDLPRRSPAAPGSAHPTGRDGGAPTLHHSWLIPSPPFRVTSSGGGTEAAGRSRARFLPVPPPGGAVAPRRGAAPTGRPGRGWPRCPPRRRSPALAEAVPRVLALLLRPLPTGGRRQRLAWGRLSVSKLLEAAMGCLLLPAFFVAWSIEG